LEMYDAGKAKAKVKTAWEEEEWMPFESLPPPATYYKAKDKKSRYKNASLSESSMEVWTV
jgi:hypothetical protein